MAADSSRQKVNMDEDSSSDWDSLTEPVPKASLPKSGGPPEVELDTDSEKERNNSSPSIKPSQQPRIESPVWTPRKDKKSSKSPLHQTPSQPPDVDFKPAMKNASPSEQQQTPSRRPGRERKGNTYDPPKSGIQPSTITLALHESDDDAALASLRKTYEQNKPRNSITRDSGRKAATDAQEAQTSGTVKSGSASKLGGSKYETSDNRPTHSAVMASEVSLATESEPGNRYHTDQSGLTGMVEESGARRQSSRRASVRGQHTSHPSDEGARGEHLMVLDDRVRKGGTTLNSGDKTTQVYYFDEARTDYYLSKHERTVAVMDGYADKAELAIQRGWREVFGVLRIAVLIVTVFIIELIKFLITSVLRPLYVTTIIIIGDRLLKPFLAAIFNGVLQPVMILGYNFAVGIRLAVGPILDIFDRLAAMVARMLQSFRLVSINHYRKDGTKGTLIHETCDV